MQYGTRRGARCVRCSKKGCRNRSLCPMRSAYIQWPEGMGSMYKYIHGAEYRAKDGEASMVGRCAIVISDPMSVQCSASLISTAAADAAPLSRKILKSTRRSREIARAERRVKKK